MSLRGVLPLALLCVVSEVVAQSVAPGDEEDDCRDLRERMIIETPSYAPNMAILMDSDNYINLLPNRTRAVWQQVDNDVNNDPGSTTNVSIINLFVIKTTVAMHACYCIRIQALLDTCKLTSEALSRIGYC